MLGQVIHDPQGVENVAGSINGLGLLEIETTLQEQKTLSNVSGYSLAGDSPVTGYEIHAGTSSGSDRARALFNIANKGSADYYLEGAANPDDSVRGTYLHGLLEGEQMLVEILNWAGLQNITPFDYQAFRERQIERLADEVEKVLPLQKICQLLSLAQSQSNGTRGNVSDVV